MKAKQNLHWIWIMMEKDVSENSIGPRVTQKIVWYVIRLKFPHALHSCEKLDRSTARRRLKSPQSLSGTSAHPTMVTLVNIMVMNGWLTSFSFHVNRLSHSWDKAISDSDLKFQLQSQGHGCGQRARSYNRPSIILPHLVFISHQSDQQFLR